MLVSREIALKNITERKAYFWRLVDPLTKQIIFDVSEDTDADNSAAEFIAALDELTAPSIIARFWKKYPATGGRPALHDYECRVLLKRSNPETVGAVANGIDLEKYLKALDDKRDAELKLKLLSIQNQDPEPSDVDRILQFIEGNPKINEGIGDIIAGAGKALTNMFGMNTPEGLGSPENIKELQNLYTRLKKIDPDILVTVRKMATYFEANPDKYQEVKANFAPIAEK